MTKIFDGKKLTFLIPRAGTTIPDVTQNLGEHLFGLFPGGTDLPATRAYPISVLEVNLPEGVSPQLFQDFTFLSGGHFPVSHVLHI